MITTFCRIFIDTDFCRSICLRCAADDLRSTIRISFKTFDTMY